MAKGYRELMKRKLEQAINHVDKINEILQEIAEGYADEHPDIVEQYKTTYAFSQQLRAILELLRVTY